MKPTKENFKKLVESRGDDGWGNDVLAMSKSPDVAAALPDLLGSMASKEQKRLVELGDETILMAMLGVASGAVLERVLNLLFRLPDPKNTIVDAMGAHPVAAKKALEMWYSPDRSRLARLAESVKSDKKCKDVAAAALAFIDAHKDETEERMVPPLSAYLGLKAIGATLDGVVKTPAVGAPAPLWHDRVVWPSASFAFSVPKAEKCVLTFEVDPEKNTRWDFHGTELRLVCFGHDDAGWHYFWEADRGAFVRTQGKQAQYLISFFDWLGKKVAGSATPTDPFVGTWTAKTVAYLSSADGDDEHDASPQPAAPNEAKLTLNADGTCTFARFSHVREGKYEVFVDALTLRLTGASAEVLTMKRNPARGSLAWIDHDEEHGADVAISLKRG